MSTVGPPADAQLLDWENLGRVPAHRAFFRSAGELLARPRQFFGKLALSGGLHEPLAFFLLVVAAVVLLALPTALAHFGATAPDAGRVPAEVYRNHLFAPQAAAVAFVLLPVILAVAAGVATLLGVVFYLPAKLFGSLTREGALGVWLYSLAASLMPLVTALAIGLVTSGGAWLVASLAPGAAAGAARVAHWSTLAPLGLAVLAGSAALLVLPAVGLTAAFGMEAVTGAAAAVAGIIAALMLPLLTVWAIAATGVGGPGGFALALVALVVLAAAGFVVSAWLRGGE